MPFVTNHGVKLAYDVSGSGPDLLLIARTSADRGLWAQIRSALDEKFRTITFDNRDSGASSISQGGYAVGDLMVDAVGSEQSHILGHPLGGMIAQEFALAHPNRVASLTLTNSWARRDTYVTSVFELARDLSVSIKDDALRLRTIYYIALGVPTYEPTHSPASSSRCSRRDPLNLAKRSSASGRSISTPTRSTGFRGSARRPTAPMCRSVPASVISPARFATSSARRSALAATAVTLSAG